MNSKKLNRWDVLDKAQRNSSVEDIIAFFREERDEEIGILAAEEVLDFFLEKIGEDVYNQGVEDSRELLAQRFQDLEVDLSLLRNE